VADCNLDTYRPWCLLSGHTEVRKIINAKKVRKMEKNSRTVELPRLYPLSMSMSIVDYIAHNRKASNALCTLVEREKKSFSGPGAKTVSGT